MVIEQDVFTGSLKLHIRGTCTELSHEHAQTLCKLLITALTRTQPVQEIAQAYAQLTPRRTGFQALA